MDGSGTGRNIILYDLSKNPLKTFQQGWSIFGRKFQNQYKFIQNREQYTKELLNENIQAIIFAECS